MAVVNMPRQTKIEMRCPADLRYFKKPRKFISFWPVEGFVTRWIENFLSWAHVCHGVAAARWLFGSSNSYAHISKVGG
jgi:hypothetical protein